MGFLDAPRSGDLELRPLPAVLLDLYEHRATGRFLVQRERVVKTVDLLDGALIALGHHDEAVGSFLAATGLITGAQLRAGLEHAAAHHTGLGAALVAMGLLSPQRLAEQLGVQTRYSLLSPMRWTGGTWRFEARDVHPGIRLSTPETVLSSLRDTACEGLAPSQILADMLLALTPRGERLLPLFRTAFGSEVPTTLPDGLTAKQLMARGLSAALLDALILTDAVVPTLPSVGPALTLKAEDLTAERSPLYAELFEGHSVIPPSIIGRHPVQLQDDASCDDFDDDDLLDDDATRAARAALVAEALRIRDLDYYAVLRVDNRATDVEIATALAERQRQFSREHYARFLLGRDARLLDDIHATLDAARSTLLDDDRRRLYDRDQVGGDLSQAQAEAERLLEAGLDRLQRGDAAAAVEKLEASLAIRPDDAEALAALGWACWHQGDRTPAATDAARRHLGKALRAKPNLGMANEYLGLIELAVGTDEHAALDYLERAARSVPSRAVVLDAIAAIYQRHGRSRGLERFYRRLLRNAERPPHDQAALWQRLGVLYSDHLDDPPQAQQAFSTAAKLGGLAAPPRRPAVAHPAKSDADYIAASLRVATGDDRDGDRTLYDMLRPRTLPRARCTMTRELWNLLRHPDDEPDIGALAELLAPAVHSLHPVTLADLSVDPAARVPEHELPPPFAQLRAYAAELLGLPAVPVYAHPDFGPDVHVGAIADLVLLAGDDALMAPERPELGFRVARATSYLWPGRAVGASRPARVMRALFLSLFRETTGVPIDEDAPERRALAVLAPEVRMRACGLVQRLFARSPDHNLSRWAQSLGRTADRFGLLVCGDVPVAIRLADSPLTSGDLLGFARSDAFLSLRAALGLTVAATPPVTRWPSATTPPPVG